MRSERWRGSALTGEAPGPAVIRGRLGDRCAGLPDALVSAVEGALRSNPEDRPDVDALAVAIFESADPEPLVLVHGGDDVSLLTRRIRAAARSTSGGDGGGAEAAGAPGRRRARRVGRRHGFTAAGARRLVASAQRAARTVAPFVAVLGVMAAVATGVIAWSGGRDDARASTAARSAAAEASGEEGGAAPAQPGDRSDVRLSHDAARTDPLDLVRALAQARAAAWSSGIAARLVEVDAARSPAMVRDTEVLAGVQRSHQRYVGLTFVVRTRRPSWGRATA